MRPDAVVRRGRISLIARRGAPCRRSRLGAEWQHGNSEAEVTGRTDDQRMRLLGSGIVCPRFGLRAEKTS